MAGTRVGRGNLDAGQRTGWRPHGSPFLRDPQIGAHHLAQLGWRLGHDDLQRRNTRPSSRWPPRVVPSASPSTSARAGPDRRDPRRHCRSVIGPRTARQPGFGDTGQLVHERGRVLTNIGISETPSMAIRAPARSLASWCLSVNVPAVAYTSIMGIVSSSRLPRRADGRTDDLARSDRTSATTWLPQQRHLDAVRQRPHAASSCCCIHPGQHVTAKPAQVSTT